jgi:hypothetical protein
MQLVRRRHLQNAGYWKQSPKIRKEEKIKLSSLQERLEGESSSGSSKGLATGGPVNAVGSVGVVAGKSFGARTCEGEAILGQVRSETLIEHDACTGLKKNRFRVIKLPSKL